MPAMMTFITTAILATAGQAEPVTPPQQTTWSFQTDDDYPAEARRLGQQGATRVTLQINAKGRVADCAVLESSGSPSLDTATCRAMANLRFKPARAADGRAVPGAVVRRMQWALPSR